MFTGLIEATGEIAGVAPAAEGFRLRVDAAMGGELTLGESVAVNGVCLTVVAANANGFQADVSPETARVTTLGSLGRGTIVNLERPLRMDARLGGHFVQGHVDAIGTIEGLRPEGDSHRVTVSYPPVLAAWIVKKGSIALDGISLTVAGLEDRVFDVQIIPFTWCHTNLRAVRPGDAVNIECDILGKYVARLAGLLDADPGRDPRAVR